MTSISPASVFLCFPVGVSISTWGQFVPTYSARPASRFLIFLLLFLLVPNCPDLPALKQLYFFNIRHSITVFCKFNPFALRLQILARFAKICAQICRPISFGSFSPSRGIWVLPMDDFCFHRAQKAAKMLLMEQFIFHQEHSGYGVVSTGRLAHRGLATLYCFWLF